MGIERLLTALLEELRRRIRDGQLTERGLARLTGISQPHLHHILKGKRGLNPAIADRLMEVLMLDLSALIELDGAGTLVHPAKSPGGGAFNALGLDFPHPRSPQSNTVHPVHEPPVFVPILDGLIGPGHPRPIPHRPPRYLPVPRREVPPDIPLLAARIAFHPQAGSVFLPNDLIVIAAMPLSPILGTAVDDMCWVLEDGGTWRVELPPHSRGTSSAGSSQFDFPPAATGDGTKPSPGQLQLDLFEGERLAPSGSATGGSSHVGVVVLCIRQMGPLSLPLLGGLPVRE